MKSMTNLLGLILVVFGIAVLAYQGFTYTKQENIAQIGDLKITANTQHTVYLSPVLGGLAIFAGLALVIIARRK